MVYFVTGGSGFIGSHLVKALLQNGHQVINIDSLTYAANPKALLDIANHSQYYFHPFDINATAVIKQLFYQYQPDGLFHLAAESHVDRSIDSPQDFIQSNAMGTFSLLRVAQEYQTKPFKFLHVSTDEVFGALSIDAPPSTEDALYRPNSPYSATKASSDHLVRAWYETYGLQTIITHCTNNYGPWQHNEKMIPTIIRNAIANHPIPIYGSGQQIRDWLYVEDHVHALMQIMKSGKIGESYNIGANNECTNACLALDILTILGKSHTLIQHVPDRLGHDFRYGLNTAKIIREIGWRPHVSFQEGLANTIQWYKDNQ